jgi:hypothetical protein
MKECANDRIDCTYLKGTLKFKVNKYKFKMNTYIIHKLMSQLDKYLFHVTCSMFEKSVLCMQERWREYNRDSQITS